MRTRLQVLLALCSCAATPRAALVSERCESKHEPRNSKCSGCPPTHGGKLCASTTRYNDQTKAACGCGPSDPVPEAWWSMTQYTAALNCKSLDSEDPLNAWCPHGCGGCYELCSTGGTTQGKNATPGVCHVFKVTNRCGDGYPDRPMWCSNRLSWKECEADPGACKKEGGTNYYGYPAHFDLQDLHLQISGGLGWDNVEVTFEPVPCTKWRGPQWDCQCKSVEGNRSAGKFLGARQEPAASRLPDDAPGPEGLARRGGQGAEEPRLTRSGAAAGGAASSSSAAEEGGPWADPNLGGRPEAQCASAHEQCGGLNWNGTDCCEAGCLCTALRSPSYRQCMPQGPRPTCRESVGDAATDVLLLKKHELVEGDHLLDDKAATGGRHPSRGPAAAAAAAAACAVSGALVAMLSTAALRRRPGTRRYEPLDAATAKSGTGLVEK